MNNYDNRFEIATISFKIDGYMFTGRKEIAGEFRNISEEESFELAKKELTLAIKKELENIFVITFDQYKNSKRKDFK